MVLSVAYFSFVRHDSCNTKNVIVQTKICNTSQSVLLIDYNENKSECLLVNTAAAGYMKKTK